jgi:NTP pyrophosphatase (non-canonical NTP hydrolase)
MKFDEYQQAAVSTAIYPDKYAIVYPALGLTGEAGEVAEKIKKVLRDSDGDFDEAKRSEIAKELGDVLWYIANLANDLGVSFQDIAAANIEKLQSRKQRNVLQGSGDER